MERIVQTNLGGCLLKQFRREARKRIAQCLELGQSIAQGCRFLGPDAAQRNAACNAFDVGDGGKGFVKPLGFVLGLFRNFLDAVVPKAYVGLIAQRVMEPLAHQSAAHRSAADVQDGKQGRTVVAAQRFADFQIPARHGVQNNEVRCRLQRQRPDERQGIALGLFDIGKQCVA